MARFFAKHLLFLLFTLLVVSFLVFTLNEFSPGAVARKILGAYATQEQVDVLTKQMGLDRPVLVRYVEYLGGLASGDLGYSARFKLPVREVIFKHLANTVLLAAIAFACIVPLSTLLGVVAGMRESSRVDRVILMFSTVVASIPEFALGVFLASVFVVWLGWLPGTATLVAGGGWSVAAQLVLPVTVVVETVFAYPGFGRMILEAALFKDIALIEAGALVAVFLAVLTNILGDIAYMLLDPRIRA